MKNITKFGVITLAGAMLLTTPFVASANGLGENEPWQFRTVSRTAVELLRTELMLKQDAGAFGPGNVTNHIGQLNVNNITAIGAWNQTTISGTCEGAGACTVQTIQTNEQSPTTAIGVGSNETTNSNSGGGNTNTNNGQ